MTAAEVNAKYQQIFEGPLPQFEYHYSFPSLLLVSIFVLMLLFMASSEKILQGKIDFSLEKLVIVLGTFVTGSAIISVLVSALLSMSTYNNAKETAAAAVKNQIEQWKMKTAEPYLASLPAEKHTLVYLKMAPEVQTETTGSFISGTGDIKSHSELLTPMVMSYEKDGKLITRTEKFPSQMDLSTDGSPVVEYVTLRDPLGVVDPDQREKQLCPGEILCLIPDKQAEYMPGDYNYMIHLPKNYRFTEIK